MRQLYIHSANQELTSPQFARAFLEGCGNITAARIVDDDIDHGGQWAGFGSPTKWKSLTSIIKSGDRDWYYGDHSYFHAGRKQWYRITKNAFQHSGAGTPDFAKLKMFYQDVKPFKKTGRSILICLHSDSFHERMGAPMPDYLNALTKKIRLYSDRPILVRTKRSPIHFELQLRKSWAVVTHSSMCALQALMNGVPAFTTADSALSSLTLHDPINIERPLYPDVAARWQIAGVLAANQWTMQEISTGQAWRKLNEKV